MRYVRVWVTEARCVDCGGIYTIDPYKPFQQICKPCIKRIKNIKRVKNISFLIFPLGILMYYLWKDKKPYLAKPALKAALIPIYILSGLYLLSYLLMKFQN